jgi:NAD(P)-dependent dehydrogenase (short-subunit alcohol dehydrogenase family)
MHIDFANKRVLVTGGTRGIGFGAVKAFLETGARVAVNGRSNESVSDAISDLRYPDKLVAAPGDVSTAAGCSSIVNSAVSGLGGLDILVNSAGVAAYGAMEEVNEAAWDQMLDINLKGRFFCIQAALAALRNDKGNVINIASDAGLIGVPTLSVYCASKAGIVNMTRALALEFALDVRVNCVCPG